VEPEKDDVNNTLAADGVATNGATSFNGMQVLNNCDIGGVRVILTEALLLNHMLQARALPFL
jgi:hypothetical protein